MIFAVNSGLCSHCSLGIGRKSSYMYYCIESFGEAEKGGSRDYVSGQVSFI